MASHNVNNPSVEKKIKKKKKKSASEQFCKLKEQENSPGRIICPAVTTTLSELPELVSYTVMLF